MTETKKAAKAREQAEAIAKLREMFPPGSKVYTILRHVARSGMSRSISVVHTDKDGTTSNVSWLVARALGNKLDRHDGITVGGCGMDMGFHLVECLSNTLGYVRPSALQRVWI